jgi:hypothetical protein
MVTQIKKMQIFRTKNGKRSAQIIAALALLLASAHTWSQEASDIWVGKFNLWEKDPITELVRITDNSQYTNQPYFFDNSRLFYTQAVLLDQSEELIVIPDPILNLAPKEEPASIDTQTDVWVFDFKQGKASNISQSPSNEYSPTPMPMTSDMSVIRVNEEGKQELWQIDVMGKPIKHLAASIEPVGYHVWINSKEVLLFVLGEPNTLQRINAFDPDAKPEIIDNNIGASLHQFEKTNWILYTNNNDGNYLYGYNTRSKKTSQIVTMPKNSEYFTVGPLGNVISSDGETLWLRKFMVKGEKIRPLDGWKPIKIKQPECTKGVSRAAIAPDTSMIALVCPRT